MTLSVDTSASGGATAVGAQARRDRRRLRWRIVAAVAIGIMAIAAPSRPVAAFFVGADSELFERVVAGVRVLKALLLVHLIGMPLAARWLRNAQPGRPLMTRVRAREPVSPTLLGLLAAAIVLGLGFRLIDLGAGLWHDEINTLVDFGRLPLREIVATYTAQNQHVLYSVLTGITFSIFGESAWALRLPAALMGTASLGAVFWFGSMVAARREALLATVLLTVSYHHVWFSQNARGYTGMLLFALIGTGLLIRLLSGGSRRPWRTVLGYAIVMALAVWVHLTAAFIAVAHFLVWVALAVRRRDQLRGAWPWAPFTAIVLAGTLTLLLYALVMPQMAETLFAPSTEFAGETPWANPLWMIAETVRGASRGLPGGWIGLAGGVTVGVAGTIGYLRRSAVVTLLMILPVVITAAVMVGTGHNLWPRFFFFAAGFAVLIAVRGTFALADLLPLARRRRQRLATAALVLVAAASATTVPRAWAPKQDYERAWDYVRNQAQDGDAIVSAGMATYAYETWLQRGLIPVADAAGLERIERTHDRTWLLYTMPDHLAGQAPDVWAKIQADYREIVAFPGTVAGGTVHVMTRR